MEVTLPFELACCLASLAARTAARGKAPGLWCAPSTPRRGLPECAEKARKNRRWAISGACAGRRT